MASQVLSAVPPAVDALAQLTTTQAEEARHLVQTSTQERNRCIEKRHAVETRIAARNSALAAIRLGQATLEADRENLKQRLEECQKRLDDATVRRRELERVVQQLEEVAATKRKQREEYIDKLKEEWMRYRLFLGVQLGLAEESGQRPCLKFVFTHINPAKPEQEFSVAVQQRRPVTVICDPEIDESEIEPLREAYISGSITLRELLCAVRSIFRRSYLSQ